MGDTLWWDAICKEMKNVQPAFEAWDKSVDEIPTGYQEVHCHLIYLMSRWVRIFALRAHDGCSVYVDICIGSLAGFHTYSA